MQADHRTFTRLVAPLFDSLYGAAMRLTKNQTEADDLVQDTMIRAWRFQDTFKPGSDVKAWLFTILRNTFINGYHKASRRSACQAEISSNMATLGVGVSVGAMDRSTAGADDLMDATATRTAIRLAIAALPEHYGIAVQLRDLDGWSYDEIAQVMEVPIGTVMSRIYRGRAALRKMLAEQARDIGIVIAVKVEAPAAIVESAQLSLDLAA